MRDFKTGYENSAPVSKRVMYNSKISIAARGLYAMYCAISDDGDTATPKQFADLCGVTENEYYRLLDELTDRGLVR